MERPVLYLDVDGVLNPWAAHVPPASWDGAWQRHRSPHTAISVWSNHRLGAALRELDVDIVWATTWVSHTDDLEWYAARSGLPPGLERIAYDVLGDPDPDNCGKLSALRAHLGASHRPVLWVDDDLGPGDIGFLDQRARTGAPGAGFACDPACGLSEQTVAAMAEFVRRCGAD